MASKRIILLAISLVAILGLLACQAAPTFKYESDSALRASLQKLPDYPQASFVVFSDPHLYDNSLGTTGKAFEAYIAEDRKLIRESEEILQSAVASIKDIKADFVLVPGDLTKDGELACHQLCAKYLGQIRDSGKKVYVIPGNHDIKNGLSEKYVGDTAERVPNITADQFVQIYNDFGFKDAIERDTDSLSYLAEPVPGLWLLALDSCLYRDNVEGKEETVGGRFSPITLQWIEKILGRSAAENKPVIIMMHHGILEHFVGQEKYYPEYILYDYQPVSRFFAAYNGRLVFTGHFHAQDITEKQWPDTNKFLFDIETGSLVTYPCPYRIVSIGTDQKAVVRTELVTSIKSHPTDFQEYARNYTYTGIAGIAEKTLMGYKVSQPEAAMLSQQIAAAFIAHYAGDESLPAGQVAIQEKGLSLPAWLVIQLRKDLIYGEWKDLPPPDNNVTLDLKTGTWQSP